MEATAQVLERGGNDNFTTNHIAVRAGFSIGTLYRYFPHKKAILRAMVESTLQRQDHRMREILAPDRAASADEIIELVVGLMMEPFVSRSRVRKRMLMGLINEADLVAKANTANMQMMRLVQQRLVEIDPQRFREPTDLSCRMLLGTMLGNMRTTLFIDEEHLHEPAFRQELVGLFKHVVAAKD
ncbi:MAG: helix-turn-helix domain-containing protein [Pseudomonadota bacterium]